MSVLTTTDCAIIDPAVTTMTPTGQRRAVPCYAWAVGPPGSVVGLAVALATLALTTQTPLMAFGVVSLLLVPAIAIWVGIGVAALMSPRRTADHTALIIGTVVLVFTAWVILLQFRVAPSSTGMPSGGRALDPPPGTMVDPPQPMNAWPQRETPRSPPNEMAPQ